MPRRSDKTVAVAASMLTSLAAVVFFFFFFFCFICLFLKAVHSSCFMLFYLLPLSAKKAKCLPDPLMS